MSEVDGHFFPTRKVRHPVFPPALFLVSLPWEGIFFVSCDLTLGRHGEREVHVAS